MTVDDFRNLLKLCPLVASVQASEGSPLDDPQTIVRLARASVQEGVRVLRLQGTDNIRAVRAALPRIPIIGLIKRAYEGSPVYITPTHVEVAALLELGCEVVALDATSRHRPGGDELERLIALIHRGGALAMADADGVETALAAADFGAEIVSTTLSGYTGGSAPGEEPDLRLVGDLSGRLTARAVLLAEGRYTHRRQVHAALQNGADGVVVGAALNDPVRQTRALLPTWRTGEAIAAFDLGGTWLRFSSAGGLTQDRVRTPPTRWERLEWMRARIGESGAVRAAVSSGGTLDPATGRVWEAKPMIPEHEGTVFDAATLGVPTLALNDGLCAALAHARLPGWAGRRVASLALGTGVGAGMVADGRLWRGLRGEYPRLNDLALSSGATVEAALGGAALTPEPSEIAQAEAIAAFDVALSVIRNTMFPEVVFVCGTVGLAPWLRSSFPEFARPSPFGADAALYGALSLAEWGE